MKPALSRIALFFMCFMPVFAIADERVLEFENPYCAGETSMIDAAGTVNGTGHVTIVLRIDDHQSSNYRTRSNLERTVPPGPFVWRISLHGLMTSGGKPLDSCAITKITLFSGKSDDPLKIDRLAVLNGDKQPDNVLAYDLGPADGALFQGFVKMTPDNAALSGKKLHAVRRPGPDALISDGISGIDSLRLQRPPGKWRVTLWTEDPGEWELLPHPYQRRITLNGITIFDENLSPQDWLNKRYLAGKTRPYEMGQTAWQALGRHRGGIVSATIQTRGEDIRISLAGDSAASRFVSAIVVEPENGAYAQTIERRREAEFNELWRISQSVPPKMETSTSPVVLAENAGSGFGFILDGEDFPEGARVTAKASQSGLDVLLWRALPRLVRTDGATHLSISNSMLLASPPEGTLLGKGKTQFSGFILPNQFVRLGSHAIIVTVIAPGFERAIRLPVTVLNQELPAVEKPSGFYLDEPPHLAWGADYEEHRGRQLTCDLAFLHRLGINANAPALSKPDATGFSAFERDVRRLTGSGEHLPALAYAPAKRIFADIGKDNFSQLLIKADHTARIENQPSIVWTLADEPSNPGMEGKALLETAPKLKKLDPSIRIAGHFNRKGDEKYAGHLDTLLVNPGFGVDAAALDKLGPEKTIWLYNMNKPRLAAGMFLHYSRATRYLQWHARMPTADPFDPTDGREGDFQMFLPGEGDCAGQPDIDADMLAMADGIVDQRWLQWLELQSGSDSLELAKWWRAKSFANWHALAEDTGLPQRLRGEVTSLARKLKVVP